VENEEEHWQRDWRIDLVGRRKWHLRLKKCWGVEGRLGCKNNETGHIEKRNKDSTPIQTLC